MENKATPPSKDRPAKKRRVAAAAAKKEAKAAAATTPEIDPDTGLPHYLTKLSADTSGTVTLIPSGPQKKPYPTVAKCGTWDCLNGPPIVIDPITRKKTVFQTYSLCDKCRKIAPDAHDLGLAIVPPEWKKPGRSSKDVAEEKVKRRNKAATALGSRCMLQLSARYPAVYGAGE